MKNPYKTILAARGLPYKTILGESSAKTVKGEKIGYLTGIVYLVPDEILCPLAKMAGCFEGCLKSAGRGAFNSVQKAREAKTQFFTIIGKLSCFHCALTCGHLLTKQSE